MGRYPKCKTVRCVRSKKASESGIQEMRLYPFKSGGRKTHVSGRTLFPPDLSEEVEEEMKKTVKT